MRLTIKNIVAICVFYFLFIGNGFSQTYHHFFIEDVLQRSYINPALTPDKTFTIASGLALSASTTGPTFNEITIQKDGGGLILSPEKGIEYMGDDNDVYATGSVHTVDINMNLPFINLSVGHAWRASGWLNYTKDLAEFITYGNGPYVGETLQLGPDINYINFNEVYLGLQKKVGAFSFGIRGKWLSGVEALVTDRSTIDLTTSEEFYEITLESDYVLNTVRTLDYREIDDFDFNISSFSTDNFLSKNSGFAFDLGISWAINDRIELSASITDIGSIDWDTDQTTYTAQGTQFFDGIDVSEYITNESDFIIEDSIRSLLDFVETNETFNSRLPRQVFIGGRMLVFEGLTLGVLLHNVGLDDFSNRSITFNAMKSFGSVLGVGVQYTARNGSMANIGLSGRLCLGPVTGFIATDNVIAFTNPRNAKNSSIRLGLNIGI